MKLLVLAQIPPPLHGQSLMVQTLVTGLPAHGLAVHHINLGLSRDAADIGRARPGKVFALLTACLRTVTARFHENCDTLYYIPAPGKRGALWRDWVVMLLCRPFFKRLVLHWHASGLDPWLATEATALERGLTRLLLGRADLSIVLADSLRADAAALAPRQIAVVPNGITDPGENPAPRPAGPPFQVLFLGLCSEEKGLFASAAAVLAANRAARAPRRNRASRSLPPARFRTSPPASATRNSASNTPQPSATSARCRARKRPPFSTPATPSACPRATRPRASRSCCSRRWPTICLSSRPAGAPSPTPSRRSPRSSRPTTRTP
ncbi:hypothetical protein Verru16b_01664 [Lacunisphaera limnophila]|uniref:Glycosyltransferase subfamily 4-like N-terminal domain-containing protein n=1 Tax=Lacunisphaera limnophila TaxID=1838286 RepID=A0A1D8AUN1_9BACT|nr:hypothetical protein Verru16b_01664 [Lacunisphaera limnophila]